MFIQSVNSILYPQKYHTYQQQKPSFQKFQKPIGDCFARKKLNPETLDTIKDIKILAKENNIPQMSYEKLLLLINNTNHTVFKNICISAQNRNALNALFNETKLFQSYATELLLRTNDENKQLLEYYTSLGCISDAIFDEPAEFMENALYGLDVKRFSPSTIENLVGELNPNNTSAITMLVNNTDLSDDEILSFVYEINTFSETDLETLESNIKNGMAKYLSGVFQDSRHPLRKELNTIDFREKCPYFSTFFNNLMQNKPRLYELLKYPLHSEPNIKKTFRDLGSLMGKVYSNTQKAFDEYEALQEYHNFFTSNILKTFGLIAITDKETALHIFDKGFSNAANFIDMQNYLTRDDVRTLSNIIKQGKRQNKNGEFVDISAKSKVYACNLININRKILANTTGELDIKTAITPVRNGVSIDFKKIENELKTKVLNQFGFSDEEVQKLNPENTNWDIHNMYLLTLPRNKNEELETIVREASKGTFKDFIYDENNIYGKNNLITKQAFERSKLNYNVWENGISDGHFKVAGEELKISLWERIPQKSIFNGTYTTCCTSLDGTHGDSMAKYLLSTAFNIMEIKDKNGDIIAQSRFFMANEQAPVLLIDNIEVNNNFKKKLYCNLLKDKFIEGIFSYYREFAKQLSNDNIPLYFCRDNNKLYNCDDIKGYQKHWLYINNLVGEVSSKDAYCNLITQSIFALPRKNISVYNVTNPMNDDSLIRFLDDGII